ncbi:exopolyphosphatase [Gordonia sp. 852002-50816_SCH5313054-c]|uniref:acyclic terpene utilization AtuA family protein n=1 Tax=unclassified Gordonia (in: high G+C Gram-positive bacteria) TaxID=2657482 RepID=UPI0007E929D0|nr:MULTISPECIES: acyclic terpene utilization AtuA family protein [unclassified Gordonia (in: high G+C Gram-positive bacteria)]OBC12541.1 exopolyphosphatase [Gordonia sp. 852002-50816_SCH5313054-a]OBC19678.1 exopolyphosphatase [Gordonia sp. 852002-50816_SCH5313054-c]
MTSTTPGRTGKRSNRPVRIGNASGFYGDRFSAMREMLEGGELDYLTGDYLAELTMLILGRDRLKDPKTGYAKTFLRQMEECLGLAVDKGVRILSNAGGLNPHGLAVALRELADKLGVDASIAFVDGDDILDRADDLGLGTPLTANAYLGAFGIKSALDSGADVVVTGRITDASLTVGPAASAFDWEYSDLDALAGAVVAGHVIECGAQATGGNYSFFTELPRMGHLGFPIAEVASDGTSVITKHPNTGGAVTVGTVTAQLLYEVGGPRYLGPDVTTRLDTITLRSDGEDRVAISGVKGEAPPETVKVSLNHLAGIRNEITVAITGLDIEDKAELFRDQFRAELASVPEQMSWELARLDRSDAQTEEQATALLRCVARDTDPEKVGRAFSNTAVELALATFPGFTMLAPPGKGSPFGVFEPGYVDAKLVDHRVSFADGVSESIEPSPLRTQVPADEPEPRSVVDVDDPGPTAASPLGLVAGARSGDKGGSANIGVWVRNPEHFDWLDATLDVDLIKKLLPEIADLEVKRFRLPNLSALNFVIEGVLGRGVADNVRFDPQAKGMGEWLRSRPVPIPLSFVAETSSTAPSSESSERN